MAKSGPLEKAQLAEVGPLGLGLQLANALLAHDLVESLKKNGSDAFPLVIGINPIASRAAAPAMIAAGFGRVVNITSINGIRGKFGQANYTGAKAGLIGLTKTAARELGPKGITVNAVTPGMMLTELAKALPQEFLDRALQETVLGCLTEPQDVANAVHFLLSEQARMITGQVLNVDAGQLM